MTREANIPLFLWIATAVVVHAVSGGGVDKVSSFIGQTLEIRDFAAAVRRQVRGANKTVEISLHEEQAPIDQPEPKAEPDETKDPDEATPDESEKEDETAPEPKKPEPKKEEPKKPELKKEEPKKPEPEKEDKPKPEAPVKPLPPPEDQRRIAVRQHVEDPNQKDNPEAEFLGDQANRVKEQTQARITSTDQNDPKPNPGTSVSSGPPDRPGNGELDKVAQSEDRDGNPDRAPGEKPAPVNAQNRPQETPAPNAAQTPKVAGVERMQQGSAQGSQKSERPDPEPGQTGQTAREASRAQEAMPDPLADPSGRWAVPEKREASIEQKGRKARKKRELPRPKSAGRSDILGLGAAGLSPGGVNLNLTPMTASKAIGEDRLWRERNADGQRRRSAHRGSWKTGGIERWRSAIENYVPSVKPGNQTALNTARAPFASYLNTVHNRLHPIFAEGFLGSLDELPGSHPMNQPELVTHLEIVLDREEGRIQRMGVTKTSGVTAFDIAALESVHKSQPFGAPPREIVSPDGNVYFHWEFFRNPQFACSTYYAHPFILKTAPKSAPPPEPAPGAPPQEYEPPPAGERHGLSPAQRGDGPG